MKTKQIKLSHIREVCKNFNDKEWVAVHMDGRVIKKIRKLLFKLGRELEFPTQLRAGHQDSAKGGKIQFPHEREGF